MTARCWKNGEGKNKHTHIHTNKPRAYDYQGGKIDGGSGCGTSCDL